ncbi:tetratricopeptide repeat protein [Haloplasma contractile]|uniref:TPR-repeat-containing protein n=1 Tax=Haloplasma contractile SSD-17B TaxID=1033810 RepID=U2FL12_9MOLU|nr:tetratricopeptide repeat protein [Haloplasma contractile]ERJ13460.1 TPR-repeat-containing protein [Haloplasma contractile SSD-17B]
MNENKRLELIYKGNVAWESKKLEAALHYLKEAELIKQEPDLLIDLALIYDELGHVDMAEKYYRKILTIDENNATAYYGIATLYDNKKQYEKAIAYYKEAIELDSSYYSAHFFLANVYDEIGETSKAKAHYEKTIDLCKSYFWAYMNLGQIYERNGENEKALLLFEKAESIDPTNHLIYFNLGVVYKKTGDFKKSISFYKKSLSLSKEYPYTYLNLALLYKDQYNDLNQSLDIYNKGILQHPNHEVLLYNRGCVHAILKEFEKATDDLYKATRNNSNLKSYMYKDQELNHLRETDVFKQKFN